MKRLFVVLVLSSSLSVYAEGKADSGKKSSGGEPTAGAKEKKSDASVNWSGQVLKATGAGAPNMQASSPAQARLGAERAAQMDAFRNLLAQAKGIQISSGKTVADEMSKDEVKGHVEGLIRGYKVTAKRYYSDNGVEIDVEVPLSAIAEVVVPASTGAEATKLACHDVQDAKAQPVSGLIIDARGLNVTPALAPRLLDEAGNTVYASDCVKDDVQKTSGVAAYSENLEEAKKSMRIGDKPLVVKAKSVQGSDLVLSAEDVKKLADASGTYLAEGRVLIVTK